MILLTNFIITGHENKKLTFMLSSLLLLSPNESSAMTLSSFAVKFLFVAEVKILISCNKCTLSLYYSNMKKVKKDYFLFKG